MVIVRFFLSTAMALALSALSFCARAGPAVHRNSPPAKLVKSASKHTDCRDMGSPSLRASPAPGLAAPGSEDSTRGFTLLHPGLYHRSPPRGYRALRSISSTPC